MTKARAISFANLNDRLPSSSRAKNRRLWKAVVLAAITISIGCRHEQQADLPTAIVSERAISLGEVGRQVDACHREQSATLVVRDIASSECLEPISNLTQLQTLELYKTSFTPDQAKVLRSLIGLKRLRLEDVKLDDKSAAFINSLTDLEVLNLPHSQLTNAGLEALLAHLPRLQLLRIGSPTITDQGIASLANAPSLRFLHLVGVPITDAGLQHFHNMRDLESLYIDGGQETDAGIRALLKANSQLHFHRNQTHVANDANADGH